MAKTNTKTKEITVVTSDELLSIIEQRQSYKRLIEEAESILKQLDEQIRKAVEDSGTPSIIVGGHKVTLSKFTRESVSAADVREIISEALFESIVKRTLQTRLTIK